MTFPYRLTRPEFIVAMKDEHTYRHLEGWFTTKALGELDAWGATPDDGVLKSGDEWIAAFIEFAFTRTNIAREGRSRLNARGRKG